MLAPLALGAVYLGHPFWDALIAVLAGLMAWEWAKLCDGGQLTRAGIALIAASLAALAVAELWGFEWSLIAVAASALSCAAVAATRTRSRPAWFALGAIYVSLPCLALIWIRTVPQDGLATLLWLLAIVWATDTAAYFAGRAIGGAKLAPRISPNKTWAGLAGGTVAAGLVGLVFGLAIPAVTLWLFIAISAGLAIVEQAGDLFESAVKRHFGVKDSGNLIPGHGGVLDRVDGLLAVAITVAVLTLCAGSSPLTW